MWCLFVISGMSVSCECAERFLEGGEEGRLIKCKEAGPFIIAFMDLSIHLTLPLRWFWGVTVFLFFFILLLLAQCSIRQIDLKPMPLQ